MNKKEAVEYRVMTIRIPVLLWKRLKFAQINGRIKSIQQAAIDGFVEILRKEEGKK